MTDNAKQWADRTWAENALSRVYCGDLVHTGPGSQHMQISRTAHGMITINADFARAILDQLAAYRRELDTLKASPHATATNSQAST